MLKFVNIRAGIDVIGSVVLKNNGYVCISNIQMRNMTSRQYRVKKDKPPPYPYEEKGYNWFQSLFDHSLKRFDENTKLIVVDGPIASGKNKLAKGIAEEFEMKYFPDLTTDIMYINNYGYDMRNLDPKLPEASKSYDEKKFHLEPFHPTAAAFQLCKYRLRYYNYWDAVTHLLNTGQGVVIVRSPFSDAAFMNAMKECNFMSYPARYHYLEMVRHTIHVLLRPHVVIYLDVPVEETIKNIKKRNIPHEVNSKGITPKFLQTMQDYYKDHYLSEASIHSKMLIYNWVEEGDTEVVVEDLETIDFDKHTHNDDLKLSDWRMDEDEMDYIRVEYTDHKDSYYHTFLVSNCYNAPEMWMSANDAEVFDQVWDAAPGMEYSKGYNYLRGDKNVWFKTRNYQRCTP